MLNPPQVTFLISTYNRREVLLHTLGELAKDAGRSGIASEIIVVDNASRDGTADYIARQFPRVKLIREKRNRGACAKNLGLATARSPFVIFLDDDSYPAAGSVRRMLGHFAADPSLGAAVFDVILPDGSHECSAYPNVFIGCGTGFRREALMQTGGLPEDFFMQAEEYDLSLRLLDGGWKIERFDLPLWHLKTAAARIPTRTTRLDTRNNLLLITRYFPREWLLPFAVDWMRRYRWLAEKKSGRHTIAFWRGLAEGILRSLTPGRRREISAAAFEQFARINDIEQRMRGVIRAGNFSSILLLDVGKNILPYYLAAAACGARIVGIADNRLAKAGRTYRGIPVVDDGGARALRYDAAIVANLSPVHAAVRAAEWGCKSTVPVFDLFEKAVPLARVA
ncbi:MAG: glycosyltransferase [Planctomycetota bacterium]|nr:glycosyltransferase [Planctomycetota bacterium]